MKNPSHETAMRRALVLAERGRVGTSPNPMVGACVVKNGLVVGEGWHQKYGGPHAEVLALKAAGVRAKGASLYVTLEPCSTWGKTPPCINAIRSAGIRQVIIGSRDLNPKHFGKGIAALKKAGVRVISGILAPEVRLQNEAFFKYIRTGLPFVTLKMAQSLDGKIAARTGLSRWITSKPAREFVHYLRAEQDAVLVGKNTLLQDNPALMPRVKVKNGDPLKPWRVALDPDFRVSPKARIFEGEQLTFLAGSEKKLKRARGKVKKGTTFLLLKENKGRLDLRELFKQLGALGAAKVLVEGGGELAWSLLHEKLVDKILWIVAPTFIGGRDAKTSVEGAGFATPDEAIRLPINKISRLGEDWLFEARL